MASRVRAGNPAAFWNNVAVGAGGTSTAVEISRSVEHIIIYVDTSAATTITVEVAPDAVQTSEGIWPEAGTVFYTLVTGAAPTSYVAAGSGKFAFQISDFVPGTVRLKSSGAATITAGYETIGD